jgi:hypothetical protein
MSNTSPTKLISKIPELNDVIGKYGCGLGSDPPYIVQGVYTSASGPVGGIIAGAQNQFYAYLICREVNKKGKATVERTEFHPHTTFSIKLYKEKVLEKVETQKREKELAQYPKLRLVASGEKENV